MKHAILEDGHQSVFIGILNNSHNMGWMAIHHIHLWNLTMSPKFGTKYIFVYIYIYLYIYTYIHIYIYTYIHIIHTIHSIHRTLAYIHNLYIAERLLV